MVKIRSGLRVERDQPRDRDLHFAETAGTIQAGNLVFHEINPLRYTQVRTIWGLEYKVRKGSPTPTGANDLSLHREREAEKSLKTSPDKCSCLGTE